MSSGDHAVWLAHCHHLVSPALALKCVFTLLGIIHCVPWIFMPEHMYVCNWDLDTRGDYISCLTGPRLWHLTFCLSLLKIYWHLLFQNQPFIISTSTANFVSWVPCLDSPNYQQWAPLIIGYLCTISASYTISPLPCQLRKRMRMARLSTSPGLTIGMTPMTRPLGPSSWPLPHPHPSLSGYGRCLWCLEGP